MILLNSASKLLQLNTPPTIKVDKNKQVKQVMQTDR